MNLFHRRRRPSPRRRRSSMIASSCGQLRAEQLERRQLLAAVIVNTAADVSDATDLTSIMAALGSLQVGRFFITQILKPSENALRNAGHTHPF